MLTGQETNRAAGQRKVRDRLEVPASFTIKQIEAAALGKERVLSFLSPKSVKKYVFLVRG